MPEMSKAEIDRVVVATEAHLRSYFQERIRGGDKPLPMVEIVVTRDPRNGELIAGGFGRLVVVIALEVPRDAPDDVKEDEKAKIVTYIRAIAIAGEAIAAVFASEAWIVVGLREQQHEKPSRHPDRRECIVLSTEVADGEGAIEYTAFVRDQGEIVFEEPVRQPNAPSGQGGIFSQLIPPPAPPEIAKACRELIANDPNIQMEIFA